MDSNQNNSYDNDNYTFWAEENAPSAEPVPAEDCPVVSDAPASDASNTGDTSLTAFPFTEEAHPSPASVQPDICEPDIAPKPKKEHRKLKRFFGTLGLAACFGVVAGAAFFGVKYGVSRLFPEEPALAGDLLDTTDHDSEKKVPHNITISSTQVSETGDMDATETVAAVVEQTMPAMVSIRTVIPVTSFFGSYNDQGGGSGIIVGSNENDLLIATNYHVIEGTSSVEAVLADGTAHTVSVKGSDADADLAILALPLASLSEDTLSKIDIAVLGDSDSSRIGQMVIAIGNALGYGPTVTVGYLSAKDREVSIQGNDMILLQTNAAINSGNSGGALLNTKGEVIGINNAKLSSTEIEGICFAIPISMATPILDDLMSREILSDTEKGYLGITVAALDSSVFETYHWPVGVYVSAVSEGGAAEAAGIYQGDIITHINGKQVTTSNQLINEVTSHRYGTVVEITLQRIVNGFFKEFTFSVTLQQHPELLAAQATPAPTQAPENNRPVPPEDIFPR